MPRAQARLERAARWTPDPAELEGGRRPRTPAHNADRYQPEQNQAAAAALRRSGGTDPAECPSPCNREPPQTGTAGVWFARGRREWRRAQSRKILIMEPPI